MVTDASAPTTCSAVMTYPNSSKTKPDPNPPEDSTCTIAALAVSRISLREGFGGGAGVGGGPTVAAGAAVGAATVGRGVAVGDDGSAVGAGAGVAGADVGRGVGAGAVSVSGASSVQAMSPAVSSRIETATKTLFITVPLL